jgi:uncharacterized membrane protein YphA (DoxX/SURF4 family)
MADLREVFTQPWVHWLALLCLCAAYLQGAFDKVRDFPGAVAEMAQAGLAPAAPFAVAVILLEIGGSLLILTGFQRWLGALSLAAFTLMANALSGRFWRVARTERRQAANAFFEHWGLVGGLLLVAWLDLEVPHVR